MFSPDKKEIKIVALGDSITTNFHVDRWTDIVTKKSKYKIINKGIGGETLKQMGNRLERDVIRLKPDICIILGGTNDAFYSNFDADKSMSEIDSIATRLEKVGIYPVVGVPIPIVNKKYDDRLMKLRGRILQSRYSTINFHWEFVGIDVKGLIPDGVHPSKKGKEIMAERAIQELDRIFGE